MAREYVVLAAGPMGAGKTTAIAALSEIPVVSTDAVNTDLARNAKATTTVALDYGEITLGDGDKVRLYGVPGQERPRCRRSDSGDLALVRQLRSGKQGLQRQAKKSRRTDCGAGGGALSRRQVAFCHWPKSPTACCG